MARAPRKKRSAEERAAQALSIANAKAVAVAVAAEPTWDGRVRRIRRIPEEHGTAQQVEIYSAIAGTVYLPHLTPDFAYLFWREDYELAPLVAAYEQAHSLTEGFTRVSVEDLARTLTAAPATLEVFRLMLGYIEREFGALCALVAEERKMPVRAPVTKATVIDLVMRGEMFPALPSDAELRPKIDKPDTAAGWESIRRYATDGVPLSMFLHQRAYGGAFRQLQDATSERRGNQLEEPVEALFIEEAIPHIRTGSDNQEMIATQFGLTVRPAPDFVVFDETTGNLRAMLECKLVNDGGTAKEKAARFKALRTEANRLGGVPLFAVLGGLGWRRLPDAFGPVVRDTDGRVFSLATLSEILDCDPFPPLRQTATNVGDSTRAEPQAADAAARYEKRPPGSRRSNPDTGA
jgi:hypothetical protein